MAQILEVVVAMLVSALLATTITTLTISPIKTQRQKNNYATAEAMAIAIRRYVVSNPSVFKTDTDITDTNLNPVYTSLKVSNDGYCTVKTTYNPPGSPAVVPYAVECTQGDSDNYGQAWQPLYAMTNFNEQTAAGTGSIQIDQCLEDISADRKQYAEPVGATLTISDLSAYTGCKNVKSSIVISVSGWSKANSYLFDFTLDGSRSPVTSKSTFKKSDCG